LRKAVAILAVITLQFFPSAIAANADQPRVELYRSGAKKLTPEVKAEFVAWSEALLKSANFNTANQPDILKKSVTAIHESYRLAVRRDCLIVSYDRPMNFTTVAGDLTVMEIVVGLNRPDKIASGLFTIDPVGRVIAHEKYAAISSAELATRTISEAQTATQAASRRSAADKIQRLLVGAETEEAEYIVIPEIWEAALAVSKANDDDEIKSLLQIAIPKMDEPLRHWQAVVLGGSIINGLTQAGVWPRTRLEQFMGNDEALVARWRRTLRLAAEMAGDARVRSGTRYDALRILGVDSFERSQQRLMPYLEQLSFLRSRVPAV